MPRWRGRSVCRRATTICTAWKPPAATPGMTARVGPRAVRASHPGRGGRPNPHRRGQFRQQLWTRDAPLHDHRSFPAMDPGIHFAGENNRAVGRNREVSGADIRPSKPADHGTYHPKAATGGGPRPVLHSRSIRTVSRHRRRSQSPSISQPTRPRCPTTSRSMRPPPAAKPPRRPPPPRSPTSSTTSTTAPPKDGRETPALPA